jgi:hypothetical protein
MTFESNRDREFEELQRAVRHNWGINVITYRVIKAVTEFVGVILVGVMWSFGSLPPTVASVIIGGIIFGVEFFETMLRAQGVTIEEESDDSSESK